MSVLQQLDILLGTVAEAMEASSNPVERAAGKKVRNLQDFAHRGHLIALGEMESGKEQEPLVELLGGEEKAAWAALHELTEEAKKVRDQLANLMIRIDQMQDGV